jgi:hypothetical protein
LIFLPIFLIAIYVVWFLYWTNNFIWKYFLDFPFSVGTVLAILVFSWLWSLFFLIKKIKGKKINSSIQAYLLFANGFLTLLAALNWGAFGFGTLMAFIFFAIYPGVIRKNKLKSDFYFAAMLLIEVVFITFSIFL